MRYVVLLGFLVGASLIHQVHAQAFLGVPVSGVNGKDYHIVNYVDWSIDSIHDHQCGSKSYDGHQGTDFVLRSFAHMDSGVNVLAAANGVVTFIKDGVFDREKESVIAKGLGNYICIAHPNKYYTYYAHLKKNSLKVKVGDTVKMGDPIAEVASSGNSTDPHLHFELWYDSLYVVDPFSGRCGNAEPLWLAAPDYDTSFATIDYGMHDELLNINRLREREVTMQRPYVFSDKDTTLNFWSHHVGMRLGDTLSINWYTPSNQLHFTYDFIMQQDWWYYYFWSYIPQPGIAGAWRVELERNGKNILSQPFTIEKDLNVSELQVASQSCNSKTNYLVTPLSVTERVDVYTLSGKWVQSRTSTSDAIKLPQGLYVLRVQDNENVCYLKQQVF